ncbi:uncharacterized protein [Nicotiana tomentosiformis]|uniref:uncharacterized protein n=1 Tax=Nicotiana tomentosiformis TaxID=4098 RepID=UPI00051AE722|nr:uncharacterized protein LOC104088093 [Nicotiana tomentosiformis]
MKPSENIHISNKNGDSEVKKVTKPLFRPAKDDSKPLLQDPILRSDPIETEEALLRLPPFPICKPKSQT